MPILEPATSPHLATTDLQFRRILLAIDFSEQTKQVVALAVQFAEMFNSELFLVNAATPVVYGTGAEPVPVETFDVNLEIAQAKMAELVTETARLARIQHHEVVAYCDAVQLIQQVITDNKIDLVIAGSHGAGGMERLALGSVAERILRNVRCPVLIAGPHTRLQRNPFEVILLAASLRPAGLRSAQYASALAEHFHSKLRILHVVEPKENKAVQPELLEQHLVPKLQQLIPADFSVFANADFRVEYGKPADLIASLALCMRPNLIVIGVRENGQMADHTPWSTLAQVIRRAPCPILCVQGHVR